MRCRRSRLSNLAVVMALVVNLAGCSDDEGGSEADIGATDTVDEEVVGGCPVGLTSCGEQCADLAMNREHCGRCYRGCADGELCAAGECALSCQIGFVECGGTCVDPQTHPEYCGASGDCAGENVGEICGDGEVCAGGTCALSCQPGFVECGGRCVDPRVSMMYCGATDDCADENTGEACGDGEVCAGGACALSCQQGWVACDGQCVDPLADPAHCGATGDCAGEDIGDVCVGGEVCSAGICALSCQAELVECGGRCIDPLFNRSYCGAVRDCQGENGGVECGSGEVCSRGVCALTCQDELVECDGRCVDPKTDLSHCGARGTCDGPDAGEVCEPGEMCSGGDDPAGADPKCQLVCQQSPVPLTNCDDVCVDLETNREHCGECSEACLPGWRCDGGECELSCADGTIACDGVCVDAFRHPDYCGASDDCLDHTGDGGDDYRGAVCRTDQVCQAGVCDCRDDQVECDGGALAAPTCIDPDTDSRFCGALDGCTGFVDCSLTNEICVVGECQASCPSSMVLCGESPLCADPASNTTYCGATDACDDGVDCNSADTDNALAVACDAGRCVFECEWPWVDCSSGDDGTNLDGCESYVREDDDDCGRCGYACDEASYCFNGICVPPCDDPYRDCNRDRETDGCEINTDVDEAHCGGCEMPCADHEVCTLGICDCRDPWLDCNDDLVTDGCESNSDTDALHCGSCEVACLHNQVCVDGYCECPDGWMDCNTDLELDGCEINTDTDTDNCGECSAVCPTGFVCDDGSCQGKLVFVTSTTSQGDLGDLSGADGICTDLANGQSLGGTWRAWLSVSGGSPDSPAQRFTHSNYPYVTVVGTVVADNWSDLVDGSLDTPIAYTETGTRLTGEPLVWTNTLSDGTPRSPTVWNDCFDWNSTNTDNGGYAGYATSVNDTWTEAYSYAPSCALSARLYCFEQ